MGNALIAAEADVAVAVSSSNESMQGSTANAPAFDVEKFKEQVAYDRDLLVEIVNLFLAEQCQQVTEMQEALAAGRYDQLFMVAHTIKGSLGSFHAGPGCAQAQELELAAKERNEESSKRSLLALQCELAKLAPALLELRDSFRPT